MDKLMIFDDKEKRRLMLINFLPMLLFLCSLVYYLAAISPVFSGYGTEPESVMTYTSQHYDTMLTMLAVFAVTAAAVLIYNIVMLARVKNLNSAHKVMWVVLLATFVPLSFILFWTFIINREPEFVPVFSSID